ncbi:glucose-6-phosphate isomerase [Patescibacteria group bacterium]|nr:glucose-6-phosphate isomerase [Patescibacteria group bacterium]
MENIHRRLKEMTNVIYDKDFGQKNPELELYEVYREIKTDKDLRWDITRIPPQMLGKEFVKTKGNRNNHGFQELYTVLKGEAIFLMQKAKNGLIEDVFAIKATPTNWIIVPPNYEIITINPSNKKTLETGNWVSNKTKNIYEDIEKFKGACYFYTVDGWLKNKNYQKITKLRFEEPLKSEPKNLDFLRTEIK